MRLLPAGADYAGGLTVGRQSPSNPRADRCGDDRQHLPLRDIPADTAGHRTRQRGSRPMNAFRAVDRREILKAGVSGGAALLLGFWLPERGEAQTSTPATGVSYKANAWISIASDDRITLLTEIPEMGQGTRTANAMMLADELEADWTTIRVEQAPTIPAVYKHLGTGGSGGTAGTWEPMRQAGAQARAMLLAAAA